MPVPSSLLRPCHIFPTSLALVLGLSACADFEVPALKKLKGDDKPGVISASTSTAANTAPQDKTAAPDLKEGAPAAGPSGGGKLNKDDLELLRKKAQMNADAIAMESALAKAAQSSGVDLSFLLSMNYNEAKAISANSIEMPMGVRIAADNIEIIKKDGDDKPKRVKATGKVYLENGEGDDMAKVLCHEALISSWEIVLRGKPIIQRGGSTIEGLEDSTVAYMLGPRLRVIGLHRLANQDSMIANLPDLGPWTSGPNPLLPPLSEDAVPNNIRDQMLKAAEAENVLQQNRDLALSQDHPPTAPWVKPDPKAPANKEAATPASAKPDPKSKKEDLKPAIVKKPAGKTEEAPPAPPEEPKKGKAKKVEDKAPEKAVEKTTETPAADKAEEKPKKKGFFKFGSKKS